jgi:hypothetical protein
MAIHTAVNIIVFEDHVIEDIVMLMQEAVEFAKIPRI